MCVCMYIYVCIIIMCACTYECVCACVCVCMYVHVSTCVCEEGVERKSVCVMRGSELVGGSEIGRDGRDCYRDNDLPEKTLIKFLNSSAG